MPAFRVKADVLPGRYTNIWFQATKPGRYHLFCAEYCGTRHSGMIGEVIVMEPSEYQAWLSGGARKDRWRRRARSSLPTSHAPRRAIAPTRQAGGPVLQGLFGRTVQLQNGGTVVADEVLRESILNPGAKITAGFQPIMPTFQGLVSEEQLLELIEYVKSLQRPSQAPPARPASNGPTPGEATPAAIGKKARGKRKQLDVWPRLFFHRATI